MPDDSVTNPLPAPRLCPNGHAVDANAAFCPTCGATLTPVPTTPGPLGEPVAVPARRRGRHRLLIIAATIVVVVVGAGVAALLLLRSGNSTKTVSATLVLTDRSLANADCASSHSIDVGDRTEIALSRLDSDHEPAEVGKATLGTGTSDGDRCTYHFSFPKVPTDGERYRFDLPIGSFTKSQDELSSNSWTTTLRWGPKKTTVNGNLVLHDLDSAESACVGQGGYSDIQFGTDVILTNQNGDILGSGSLGIGEASGSDCTYHFTVSDIREDEEQYAIEISHRGKVVASAEQLRNNGWKFDISLGN